MFYLDSGEDDQIDKQDLKPPPSKERPIRGAVVVFQ